MGVAETPPSSINEVADIDATVNVIILAFGSPTIVKPDPTSVIYPHAPGATNALLEAAKSFVMLDGTTGIFSPLYLIDMADLER